MLVYILLHLRLLLLLFFHLRLLLLLPRLHLLCQALLPLALALGPLLGGLGFFSCPPLRYRLILFPAYRRDPCYKVK